MRPCLDQHKNIQKHGKPSLCQVRISISVFVCPEMSVYDKQTRLHKKVLQQAVWKSRPVASRLFLKSAPHYLSDWLCRSCFYCRKEKYYLLSSIERCPNKSLLWTLSSNVFLINFLYLLSLFTYLPYPRIHSLLVQKGNSKDSKIISHYLGHHKKVTKISFSVKQWPRPRTAKCIKGLFPTSCHDIWTKWKWRRGVLQWQ